MGRPWRLGGTDHSTVWCEARIPVEGGDRTRAIERLPDLLMPVPWKKMGQDRTTIENAKHEHERAECNNASKKLQECTMQGDVDAGVSAPLSV